jgi:protein-disulfide isomerase
MYRKLIDSAKNSYSQYASNPEFIQPLPLFGYSSDRQSFGNLNKKNIMLKPSLDLNRDHIFGHRLAPIELVEYGDLQCPNCAEVYPEIKMLQELMGSQLKFAFRHYPLPHLHPMALDAAVACELAALQEKFWHMHDMIFEIRNSCPAPVSCTSRKRSKWI